MKTCIYSLALLILVLLSLSAPGFGFVFVFIFGCWLIIQFANKPSRRTEKPEVAELPTSIEPFAGFKDLLILRMELNRLLSEQRISQKEYQNLIDGMDAFLLRQFYKLDCTPDSETWNQCKNAAWDQLKKTNNNLPSNPPWSSPINTDADEPVTPVAPPKAKIQNQTKTTEASPDLSISTDRHPKQLEPPPPLPVKQQSLQQHIDKILITDDAPKTRLPSEPNIDDTPTAKEIAAKKSQELIAIKTINSPAQTNKASKEPTPLLSVPAKKLPNNVNVQPAPPVKKPTKPATASQTPMPETSSAGVDETPLPSKISQQYAWQRQQPNALERTLKKVSGWHALITPFLTQNIGWFIGIFCFVAGSIFMVTYTTGYAKNLTVFVILFIYTLFLLWGGYQLRLKRTDLKASSTAIFILSILLIPLATATGSRLMLSSDSTGQIAFSLALIVIECPILYFAVKLVSGLMDRSLQNTHPKIFFALAYSQLFIPLFSVAPYWQTLMTTHLLLLGVLFIGAKSFSDDWLKALFVDRRSNAYYAAGTLFYAALVAFFHSTLTALDYFELPAGYTGPFLMMLCGLLFYLDARIKKWIDQAAYLSKFNFFIYGLSILALLLVYDVRGADIVTLLIAILVYTLVVYHYLSFAPLYLLLICCSWLYFILLLQPLTVGYYFLAGLPGLTLLYWSGKWAMTVSLSRHLATIVLRVFYLLFVGLLLSSLAVNQPGAIAFSTALIACAFCYWALQTTPEALFIVTNKKTGHQPRSRIINLLHTNCLYCIPFLFVVSLYYAPPIQGLSRSEQLALELICCSAWLSYKGLTLFTSNYLPAERKQCEILLNSALITLFIGLFYVIDNRQLLIITELFSACLITGWISYTLRLQCLFYTAILLSASAGYLTKINFYPSDHSGITANLIALTIMLIVWLLDYPVSAELENLNRDRMRQKAQLLPSFSLLWVIRVNPKVQDNENG